MNNQYLHGNQSIADKSNGLDVAVLFLIFNRPDTTYEVFEAIRKAKPSRLYVASDGARENVEGELEKVMFTRKVIEKVDWECEVKTLFRTTNLGCGKAVSSAINWFFEHEEAGIILEDDCLPSPSFFLYCEELLNRYKDDERIMAISGNNFIGEKIENLDSYYFSMYNHIWGWATWKRAWSKYDYELSGWSKYKKSNFLKKLSCDNKLFSYYWTNIFDRCKRGDINTWDYQWTLSCWLQSGLICLPEKNLVKNIGLECDATHQHNKNPVYENMERNDLEFPLRHPESIVRNVMADSYTDKMVFQLTYVLLFKKAVKKIFMYVLNKINK